jgi:arylsulfatase
MFTGLHVEEHNVTTTKRKLDPQATIWHKLSSEYEYNTGVFSGNTFLTQLDTGLSSSFNYVFSGSEPKFESGIDPVEYHSNGNLEYTKFALDSLKTLSPIRSFLNGLSKLRSDRNARKYADAFLKWKESVDKPWAATINFMDAHTEYKPPNEFNKWATTEASQIREEIDDAVWEFQCEHRPWSDLSDMMDLYDGCIRYVDHEISRIIESLKHTGEYEDTLIIITADHGEGFGEKSRIRPDTRLAGHGESKIHEAVLHVPLLVKFPKQITGSTIEEPVSLTYLPELIKSSLDGTNTIERFVNAGPVLSTAVGLPDTEAESGKAETYCDDLHNHTGYARAVFKDGEYGVNKYMTWRDEERSVQLNGKTDNDLEEPREIVEQSFSDIYDARVSHEAHQDIDDEVYDRLEELGYA